MEGELRTWDGQESALDPTFILLPQHNVQASRAKRESGGAKKEK